MMISDERLIKIMDSKIITSVDAEEITDRMNLAVVAVIEKLEAIPNKDRIELVYLKDVGYTFICEKGHAVGDFVVYVKYDSVVPNNELFSWMAESKFRVKAKAFTEKDDEGFVLKKIYSQGIVLPLDTVFEFISSQTECNDDETGLSEMCYEGTDWTTILGVTKYIPPPAKGEGMGNMNSKGDFPTHLVSKTDEVNLASKIKALNALIGKPYYITQKIEGSSLTVLWDDENDELMVCSRNNQLIECEGSKFWQAVNKHNLKEQLKNCGYIFQCEVYGSGIQKNKLGIEGVDIACFNVVEKATRRLLDFKLMNTVCCVVDIPVVTVIEQGESFNQTFDELQQLSDNQKYPNGEACEGIVLRPQEPFMVRGFGENFSCKIINRDYKL